LQVTLAGSDFDTLLAVYTGTAVNVLTLVTSNDNCALGISMSCVTFSVLPGTAYSVQVDGVQGSTGTVSITVSFGWAAPPNDAFSAAETTLPANGTTLGATLEKGEPVVGYEATRSVWYRFTAPVASTSATVRRGKGSYMRSIACCLRRLYGWLTHFAECGVTESL
jgi:hypothetical protein